MSDNSEAAGAPFDPEFWVSMPDAVALVQSRKVGKNTKKTPLIRKVIIGALIRRRESGLESIAAEYRESFVRLSDEPPSIYKASPEREKIVDSEFWRLHHAWDEFSEYAFRTGNFSWSGDVTWGELPAHLRDRDAEPRAKFQLHQEATGVHVDRECLQALIEHRDWQQWASIAEAARSRRQGPPREFMWHEVAGMLAVEASYRPEILRQGPGPVIQFVTDELTRLNNGNAPDAGEVSRFAKHFWRHWSPNDHGPPPN